MSLISRSKFLGLRFLDRLVGGVRQSDAITAALEQHFHPETGVVMVVHHEQVHLAPRPLFRPASRRACERRGAAWLAAGAAHGVQDDDESRALVRAVALHRDGAAVRPHHGL